MSQRSPDHVPTVLVVSSPFCLSVFGVVGRVIAIAAAA